MMRVVVAILAIAFLGAWIIPKSATSTAPTEAIWTDGGAFTPSVTARTLWTDQGSLTTQ